MITGFTTPSPHPPSGGCISQRCEQHVQGGGNLRSERIVLVGRVVERELSVLNEGKEKWAFETDVFSNGYKIFLFLRRPPEQQEVTIPLF
jgi:hypothetical protein